MIYQVTTRELTWHPENTNERRQGQVVWILKHSKTVQAVLDEVVLERFQNYAH
jgi:hypothetical protein